MTARRSKPKCSEGNSATSTIAFRLPPESLQALMNHASSLGKSPHLLARELVEQALAEAEECGELGSPLAVVRLGIKLLREDMATMAKALLIKAGKVDTEKAEAWVRENFQ
jgi:hypothetical protein